MENKNGLTCSEKPCSDQPDNPERMVHLTGILFTEVSWNEFAALLKLFPWRNLTLLYWFKALVQSGTTLPHCAIHSVTM
jgi:hypothetical protein